MHRRRFDPRLIAAGGLLLLAAAAWLGIAVLTGSPQPTPTPTPTPSPSASPSPTPSPSPSASPSPTPSPTPIATCPMDGTELSDPDLATRIPMLVQIENNPTARPPSGLNLADLVIEAPVEGDTTRFGAVFMCSETVGAGVGPVRSARYYNIDFWQQMRAVTFHFGGAGKVLARFNRLEMPYANGLTGGWGFFYRAGPWAAPHNVYLDVDAGRDALEDGALAQLGAAAGEVRAPFVFEADPELPAGRSVGAVGLQTASFWRFGWEWDTDAGTWLRTDAGAPNTDRLSGERLSARTIVVQIVEQDVLVGENDPGGFPRRFQHLVGTGDGVIYVNGEAHDVRWERSAAEDVTGWTYADTQEPVILPPGRVWWEIVPIGTGLSEN